MGTTNSKQGKCVLLARVSTIQQDYNEQLNAIRKLAIDDGYAEENHIVVAEKESGISIDSEDRKGIRDMYKAIEEENVTAVYANQIDRISRRRAVLFTIVEKLQQKKIQLVIREPHIEMLNEDGTENMMASMVFVMFAQLAELEMRTKKERFRLGRLKLANAGLAFSRKSLPYGYDVDETRHVVINEHKADIVRTIFNMYIDGNSYAKIAKELQARGDNLKPGLVRAILHKPAYYGEKTKSGIQGLERTLPAIITQEVYDAANGLALEHKRLKKAREIYWAEGLVVCPQCGHIMLARNNPAQYYCRHCNAGVLSVDLLDSALWHFVKPIYVQHEIDNYAHDKEEKEKELKLLRKKYATLEKAENKWEEKRDRIMEAWEEGYYTTEKRDNRLAKLEDEMIEHNQAKASLQVRINLLTTELSAQPHNIFEQYATFEEIINRIDQLLDPLTMQSIIKRFVAKVTFEFKTRRYKEVKIFTHEYPNEEAFAGKYTLLSARRQALVHGKTPVPIIRDIMGKH